MPKIDIDVHHVTRVEGHGNIRVRAQDGKIEKVEWQVPEAPRFFEAMVRGKNYEDIQTIVSRICGICSVSHSLAAIKAVEDALGIEVSQQTDALRMLLHYGEQIESHALHVGYLVAPDLLGEKSIVPVVASHPELVGTVIKLHKLGNNCMELLGGRPTHPVTIKPGGFTQLPKEEALKSHKKKLTAALPLVTSLAEALITLVHKLPVFQRETEYISLKSDGVYAFYSGNIASTDIAKAVDIHQFESVTNEYVSPHSTAKWCKWHRDSYAVGALSRYNINGSSLLPEAAALAAKFGLARPTCNPFLNSVAQVVELAQVIEHSIMLIDDLLVKGIVPEKPKSAPRSSEGVGCVEAPRGILFHRYALNARGECIAANICIPTGQNHGNIQKDFEAILPQIMDKKQDEIRLILEMLVRSYDPCISCSTHFLNVEFV